jgi:membrane protein insertase Oxa1/YidC/SpoIIIJ
MELTLENLVNTYITVTKTVKVYESPANGDAGKPVWFSKYANENAGKLYSWIDKNPSTGKKYKYVYLMFKLNDDFNTGTKAYFIRLEKGIINWEATRQELLKKKELETPKDWNAFFGWANDVESKITATVTDYVENIKDTVNNALGWGLGIAGGVLFINFVLIPEIRFRRQKAALTQIIREAKK